MVARRHFLLRAGCLMSAGLLAPRMAWAEGNPSVGADFHVGTYDFLRDRSLDFQLNRWTSLGGEPVLREIRAMLPRLISLEAWRNEFAAASQRALAAGNAFEAAVLARSAEFFMVSSDPRKRPLRERFVTLMRSIYAVGEPERAPYDGGYLPFYRFTPSAPRATVVLFGGFDSYIEEFFPILMAVRDRGFDVVAFEGPGQGGALEDSGITMTPEWEHPVRVILDRLSLSGVTLVGISLGGCLVVRAAAHEPRVTRVVAWDALTDFLECLLRAVPSVFQRALHVLLGAGADSIINTLTAGAHAPLQEWGLAQAMHVFGVKSPAAVLRAAMSYGTQEASLLVRQDVLLLAGAEDHYVPNHQIYDQARWLANARSVTVRMFTRAENAQSHCQVGNFPLALGTITDWIDQFSRT